MRLSRTLEQQIAVFGDEVDELRWLTSREARKLLTYDHDRILLKDGRTLERASMPTAADGVVTVRSPDDAARTAHERRIHVAPRPIAVTAGAAASSDLQATEGGKP